MKRIGGILSAPVFLSLAVSAAFGAGGGAMPPQTLMKVGEVKPQGWMLNQLKADLEQGIVGAYGKISDNVSNNLFARQSRQPGTKVLGNRGLQEKAWWAGEHEGYWMDALVRTAILTDNRACQDEVKAWAERILEAEQKTGYIGIYDEKTRFPAAGYDGELWTQSRVFQALLAWYEHTGDARVLKAVERTVHKTIDHYRASTYFGRKNPDGGVTHGVGYMDSLEWLYRLTGDRYYADAAVWLYEDYSKSEPKFFTDMKLEFMLDAARLWQDHTPHVAEGLYMPGAVAFFTGDPRYKQASDNVPVKLARHTNPGGGFLAGELESIAGALGGGDVLNEYCAKTEGIGSLSRLFAYQGGMFAGDWSEVCALNAAQGARFQPVNKAVIYLSCDNRRSADDPKSRAGRELFSASHTAAACCALNAMRLMPAYVEGMWFRSTGRPELWANLYGPSVLTTTVGGAGVKIEERTDYPFSDRVTLRLETDRPVAFDLLLRVPPGSGKVEVTASAGATVQRGDRQIRVAKEWRAGDEVSVNFDFQIERRTQVDGRQAYYQRGPLVFCLPFPAQEEVRTNIVSVSGKVSGFSEYLLRAKSSEGWEYRIDPGARFESVPLPGDLSSPWAHPTIGLKGTLLDQQGKPVSVTLVPLGSTLLRRTTFPLEASAGGALDAGKKAGKSALDIEKDPMRAY